MSDIQGPPGPAPEPHKAEEMARCLARQKLAEADQLLRCIDPDWKAPPYNPILIAQALGIRCIPVCERPIPGSARSGGATHRNVLAWPYAGIPVSSWIALPGTSL